MTGAHRQKYRASYMLTYAMLIFMILVCVFPFFWLLRSAFMSSGEIFAMPMRWLPERMRWENFSDALTSFPFASYFGNTLVLVALNMAGNIFSSSFAAFGFSRISFKGRDLCFALVIATMMIPSSVIQIPQFLIWLNLGLYDTLVPLWLPSFFLNAFFIFMVRQFYMTIPRDYDEAATIDGAGYLRIYAQIVMPLSKPVMATVGVFTFMWTWNDFFGPLIYLKSKTNYTLALGLQSFLDRYVNQWHYLMAASSVVILPMILLFFFAQRFFIEGITFSGIKG
ncbi:carbohydrate ABC transporter permease [Bacillota bacterium Meth-B3]